MQSGERRTWDIHACEKSEGRTHLKALFLWLSDPPGNRRTIPYQTNQLLSLGTMIKNVHQMRTWTQFTGQPTHHPHTFYYAAKSGCMQHLQDPFGMTEGLSSREFRIASSHTKKRTEAKLSKIGAYKPRL